MRHRVGILLENEVNALARVIGVFSARAYSIETLTMTPTEDKSLSWMTIVTTGSDEMIEKMTKYLNRLIGVVKVVHLGDNT